MGRRLAQATTLALLAALALPALARASTVTWTYGTQYTDHANSSWYDPENWSPEQVPRAEDDVSIPFGEGVPSDYAGGTLRSLNVLETGLDVEGDLTLTAGISSFSPYTTYVSGSLTVGAAATLIIQGDYNDLSGTDTVVNYGTIVGHDIGYPHPSIGAPVYNHGTVTCDAGTLWLYQGGVSYTGSTLGGGAGTVQLFDGASYGVDWTLQQGCALVGGVELADLVAIPTGATVECSGTNRVDLYGGLFGPGTLRVKAGSTLALGGWGSYDDGITLDNDGVLLVKDSDPYQWHGGTRIDNSGVCGAPDRLRRTGRRHDGGARRPGQHRDITSSAVQPYIDMALDNRGTINVSSGELRLQGGTNVPATGDFLGTGAGRVCFFGRTWQLADGVTLQNVRIDGAGAEAPTVLSLPASATVTMEGTGNSVSDSRIEGPGTLLVSMGSRSRSTASQGLGRPRPRPARGARRARGHPRRRLGRARCRHHPQCGHDDALQRRRVYGRRRRGDQHGTHPGAHRHRVPQRAHQLQREHEDSHRGHLPDHRPRRAFPSRGPDHLGGQRGPLRGRGQDRGILGQRPAQPLDRRPGGLPALLGGQGLATPALANQGTVRIGEASSLTTTGPYTQSSGRTTLVAPTSTLTSTGASAAVTFSDGYLYGCGTVAPSLTNTGACLRPSAAGTPYGRLSVAGPYTQGAAGTLEIDLGGTAAGQYDVLAASGAATLAGALRTASPAGYLPAKGDSFAVLTCGSRSGTFLSTGGKKRSARPAFQFVYAAGGLTLKGT